MKYHQPIDVSLTMTSGKIRIPSASRLLMSVSCLLLSAFAGYAQNPFNQLKPSAQPPKDILSTRSVVLYDYRLPPVSIQEIQKSFQQIGIDAVAWFDEDEVLAGRDATRAFADYFVLRQITNLIFIRKTGDGYLFMATPFNQKPSLFEQDQFAWKVQHTNLSELIRTVFQDSWSSQRKQNFLINEFPETDITVNPIRGNRQEFYAIDLKVDNLAVPKFGNDQMDKELESIFQNNYPLRYKLVPPGQEEQELRRQGFHYVLCYVHTRGTAARSVMGYDMSRKENVYPSITFPDGQLQLKTIPADTAIYKFYFRHIDNGNVFLGTKWDADITWQAALKNQIIGFKTEARIN